MKKWMLAFVLVLTGLALCLPAGAGEKGSGKKLIIGTMPNVDGVPVYWAKKAGYYKDAGLDVDILIFATGAPINEAMAADSLHVAVTGPAAVYALATGRYKYIGDGMVGLGGEMLYARPKTKFAEGKDSSVPGVIGNKAAVKGSYILGPLSTTAHLGAIKYVESFGLTSDDFNMVSMDHAQAYQAFVAGQGDMISSTFPFSNKLKTEGYVKLADLTDFTGPIVEVVYAQQKIFDERKDDLVKFLDCYYRACTDLVKDKALREKTAFEYYSGEGRTYSKEDMDAEIALKTYPTVDDLLTNKYPFGKSMVIIGEFFTKQGMIEKDMFPNIAKSMDDSLIQVLKEKYKK